IAAIRETLDALKSDVVHGWGTEDVYALAAVRSGYRHVVSMQGILTHYALHTRLNAREYFQALVEWHVLRRVRELTCESRWAAGVLARRAKRARIHQVEYGVDPLFFRAEWQPNPQRKAAIFIGSLTPRKGIQDAVEAFADPQLKDCELWVVGGGSGAWVEALKRSATKNVHWLNYLGRDMTAEKLGAAWCMVLPTRCDTSPNVVKEARVLGLPVITTPCGGQSDYIEDGKNGFLVAPRAVPELANRLAHLLEDLGRCREFGRHRHAEQRAFFQPENTAKAFAGLYPTLG
ncbi:MAG: glycosyltransferase family 4 protein, partial [Verrucomicrobiota bacterium]